MRDGDLAGDVGESRGAAPADTNAATAIAAAAARGAGSEVVDDASDPVKSCGAAAAAA
jgi:hypothetical protein